MKKNRTVIVIASLIVLACLIVAFIKFHMRPERVSTITRDRINMSEALAAEGAIDKPQTWMTITTLHDKVAQSGEISNQQLSWLITELNAPSNESSIKDARILAIFGELHDPNPQQKKVIYDATYPLLINNDPQDVYGLKKSYACRVMAKLGMKNAVPAIRAVIQFDKRPRVVATAKEAISTLL